MTSMSLLPMWLRVGWIVALAVVIAMHVWHGYRRRGQPRWWHGGHVLMAAGMLVMYLPGAMAGPVLGRVGTGLFAVAASVTTAVAVGVRQREGALNPLWVVAAVDMLVMTYMWLPAATRPAALDYALAAYLGCQAVAWAVGLWNRVPVFAAPVAPIIAAPASAATDDIATGAEVRATVATTAASMLRLSGHCTPSVRVSLAVMAAGMGYMLIAM